MPVLATPQDVALHRPEMNARPLMEIATVVQTAISWVIVVKISTVLQVMCSCTVIKPLICVFITIIAEPRICEDVGITKCCNDASGAGLCDVHYQDSGNNHCSCNVSCHRRGDCCPDAQRFCVRKLTPVTLI